jgi:aspartyl-tRNA(Asn)/glutamyl-tRNA(Gln) amidotransferase subunit B
MIDAAVNNQYKVTIGIECHVQLKTKTKLFAAVGNDAREAAPNTLVSHICFGLPGALPVLNKEAVHLAARAAFALGTEPQRFSKFDRKHYFYPDLPLGYQITQYDEPIVLNGEITINVEGEQKRIGITRAHLEADAGKSTHPNGTDYSLVDLNRVGTPLLEIVSEPELHTPAEAKAYARELYLRMKYANVSDANLYYGNMRFDVNVSVSKTDELGTRTETKNINSFRAVEKVVEYETNRQIEELEKGNAIIQETRGWDDSKLITISQRTKENAHDYRYFPDPDLPPVTLTDDYVEQIKKEMPVMPDEWRTRLSALGLDLTQVETLLDANLEFEHANYLDLIEQSLNNPEFAKQAVNWIVNIDVPFLRSVSDENEHQPPQIDRYRIYREVHRLIQEGKLSSTNAKQLIQVMIHPNAANAGSDIEHVAQLEGFIQESDESAIAEIVASVLGANVNAAEDVKNGEMKAIGFLVGQVMKQSQGKANPQLAQKLIKEQLGL